MPALPVFAAGAVRCLRGREEISWAERLTQQGLEAIQAIKAQKETNLHNLPVLQNYLHRSFIASGLFLGWFGWCLWLGIDALPLPPHQPLFLAVALSNTSWDRTWITLGDRIRNDQEAIEVLMAVRRRPQD